MFFIINLGSGFQDKVYSLSLRKFFRLKFYIVLGVAELTSPDLLMLTMNLAVFIEYGLARCAEDGVASCKLALVLQAIH